MDFFNTQINQGFFISHICEEELKADLSVQKQ